MTSTPVLNSGGQSEELGSDGVTPHHMREGFQSTPQQGWGQRFQAGFWGMMPCPILPKAVMTPPHAVATSPKTDRIVANPQLSWWEEEEADQADRREGDPVGMSTERPT